MCCCCQWRHIYANSCRQTALNSISLGAYCTCTHLPQLLPCHQEPGLCFQVQPKHELVMGQLPKKNNNKQTNKQTTNTHKIISEQATDPTQSLALQSARKDSSRGKNSKILDYVVLEASEFSKLPQSCRINSKQNQTQLTDSHGLGNPQVEHLAKIAPRFIGNKILPSCQYSPSS